MEEQIWGVSPWKSKCKKYINLKCDRYKENHIEAYHSKFLKIECNKKILKSFKKTGCYLQKAAVRMIADFSKETSQRECTMYFKLLKDNNCQPQNLYPATRSLKTDLSHL